MSRERMGTLKFIGTLPKEILNEKTGGLRQAGADFITVRAAGRTFRFTTEEQRAKWDADKKAGKTVPSITSTVEDIPIALCDHIIAKYPGFKLVSTSDIDREVEQFVKDKGLVDPNTLTKAQLNELIKNAK